MPNKLAYFTSQDFTVSQTNVCVSLSLARGGRTVVELLPHHPHVEGSSPSAAERENSEE